MDYWIISLVTIISMYHIHITIHSYSIDSHIPAGSSFLNHVNQASPVVCQQSMMIDFRKWLWLLKTKPLVMFHYSYGKPACLIGLYIYKDLIITEANGPFPQQLAVNLGICDIEGNTSWFDHQKAECNND